MSLAYVVMLPGQSTIELTFTANNNGNYVVPDSIRIVNLTQGGESTLIYPDTSITIYQVGIDDNLSDYASFTLQQNYPNPFLNETTINFTIPFEGYTEIMVYDITGKEVAAYRNKLKPGSHSLNFIPGNDKFYFLQLRNSGYSRSIKMINMGSKYGVCKLYYTGQNFNQVAEKSILDEGFNLSIGDEYLFVCFSALGESGFVDTPETNTNYNFQFATNIPCLGVDSVLYEDQWYHTIQVFNQCWLKENLNVGEYLNSSQTPTNNGVIEKYCMGDIQTYCSNTGGMYFWDEMMQYTNEPGGQGICPDGWHVPTDMEWKILEGAVDSEYSIGDPEWDGWDWRGSDAGGMLKEAGTQNWWAPNTGATDDYGFTALPGGYYVQNAFWGPGYKGIFWSSDVVDYPLRVLEAEDTRSKRQPGGSGIAVSVRCIKD